MLELVDLIGGYGRARILRGLSLQVGAGELVMLLGRNGAGKSTTLKTIMGLLRAEGGGIRFAGREITGWEPHRIARAGLGYVPEERRIFTDLTVMENLEVGRQAPREGLPPWTPERLFTLFPNLGHMRDRPGGRMSGGEQQMLAIGGLLFNDRIVSALVHIVVDEPTLPWSYWWAPLLGMGLWPLVFVLLDAVRFGKRGR